LGDILFERAEKLIKEGRYDDDLDKLIRQKIINNKAFEQKIDALVNDKVLNKLSNL
jgi:hypothetical protein